jgi:molybdopterin-binding protein
MKLIIYLVVCFSLVVGAGNVSARGIAQGKVTKITAGSTNINIFLSVDITAVSGEDLPACSTTVKEMVIDPADKAKLAILLTAKAMDSTVKMVGTGTCTIKSTVETISFIQILD